MAGYRGGFGAGDYATAITHLIDQNREVMAMRGGAAPWVRFAMASFM